MDDALMGGAGTGKQSAILLAAGQGARLGGVPKALIAVQGEPLIVRYLRALQAVGIDELIVVSGYYYLTIEECVREWPVRVVRNSQPARGQASSVRLGLEALRSPSDAVMMMVCDLPLLNTADVRELVTAFRERPWGEAVVPIVHGQRGNPVVFSRAAIEAILACDEETVCRTYLDRYPGQVYCYETSNQHYVIDIDTPEDLATVHHRTGWTIQLPQQETDPGPSPFYDSPGSMMCKT